MSDEQSGGVAVTGQERLTRGGESIETDAGKLRLLADWLDIRDDEQGYPHGSREVQADLRRIAGEIEGGVAGSPVHEDEPDDLDHAETEELICAAAFTYCDYNDGSGDDGFPAFALIRIEGQWTAVCAYHAQAAAAGEMERNWIVRDA